MAGARLSVLWRRVRRKYAGHPLREGIERPGQSLVAGQTRRSPRLCSQFVLRVDRRPHNLELIAHASIVRISLDIKAAQVPHERTQAQSTSVIVADLIEHRGPHSALIVIHDPSLALLAAKYLVMTRTRAPAMSGCQVRPGATLGATRTNDLPVLRTHMNSVHRRTRGHGLM